MSSSVYTPGAYNRLESVDDGTTVTVFGYDPEGNLVLRFVDADESGSLTTGDTEVTEYVWDHRNRLVGVYSFDTFDDYDDYIPGTNDTRSQRSITLMTT